MALVSVVINNFNYGHLVKRALDSALAQTAEVEIVVVDDGSTDGSRAALESYGRQVKLVFQANGGQAAAINAGVAASTGEFVAFLDADDWWEPGKVAAVAAAMRADPGVVLAYHRLQPAQADGTPMLKPIPRTLCAGDLSARMARAGGWWPFPMTSAVAVRRSAWDEAGPIPGELRISADAWLVGVYPFLGRVAALPESLGFYCVHGANNWFREAEDSAMMRKKMAHWQSTVRLTNRFLEARGRPAPLRIEDHFPYQLGAARLSGATAAERVGLALRGMRFGGEPHLARRVRNALRDVASLPRPGHGLATALPE